MVLYTVAYEIGGVSIKNDKSQKIDRSDMYPAWSGSNSLGIIIYHVASIAKSGR